MKTGVISKIFDYYFSQEKYKADIERGLKEFLNIDKDSVVFSVDEKVQPYFMEWLMFDFDFNNGRKMVEDYCELNPYELDMIDLAEYKYLTKNIYGFFEILKVDEGKGVEVKNPLTGEVFYVREVSMTYQVKSGDLVINRVSKIGDYYEFVGSDSLSLGKISSIEKFFPKSDEKLTPKEIYHGFVLQEGPKRENIESDISLEEAEKRLAEILKKSILGKHISLEIIKKWFKELPEEDSFPVASKIIKIIMDLLVCRRDPEEEYLDEIIKLIVAINNNTPKEDLGGKTPYQKVLEVGGEYNHDIALSKTDNETEKIADDFMKLMNSGKLPKAVDKVNIFFRKAQEEYYASPEIFRIYANVAVCYFYLGRYEEGWEMLDISLSLNSNYDFGLELSEKFKDLKQFRKKRKTGKKSPAVEFYDFLKKLEISYETEEKTESKKFTIKSFGVSS